MRKLLYILPVLLILGFAACENYVDITPTERRLWTLPRLIMNWWLCRTGVIIRRLLLC